MNEMPSSAEIAAAEAMVDIADFETANDVALFLDDPLGEIAAQELARYRSGSCRRP